jgi:hypothetical protein
MNFRRISQIIYVSPHYTSKNIQHEEQYGTKK